MESNKKDYHISFFKPTTEQAKLNRNLVLVLIIIWAVAVFGFHFLLRIIEKPTPEQAYLKYEKVWEKINAENANTEEMQEFAHASLSVLGKVFVKPDQKAALNNALSWTAFQLADSTQKELLKSTVQEFEKIKGEITSISDPAYIKAKDELASFASKILGLKDTDIRTKLVAVELHSESMDQFTKENKELIPTTMSTYLIHNQSFLTDSKFLGFPFHYFYSAVFLLVLFVFLCWIYCVRIDKMNVKLGIEE